MADKIFGAGHAAVPLKLVRTPVVPDFGAKPQPVYIDGLPKVGAAVANATDATSALTQLNALLASLRAAGVIA